MLQLIALIILIGSTISVGVILFRKVPALAALPDENITKEGTVAGLFARIKSPPFLKSFSFEILLQKILSKIRILTLKIENQTASWLELLRAKAQKKKVYENDNYWKEIKEGPKFEAKRDSKTGKKE